MENIKAFCGIQNNDSYVIWIDSQERFSDCFIWTVIANLSHVTFLAICAYLFGVSKKKQLTYEEHEISIKLLKLLCVLEILNGLLEVVLGYFLEQFFYLSYALQKVLMVLCWSSCLLLQYRGYPSIMLQRRKHVMLLTITLLEIISSVFEVHGNLRTVVFMKYGIQSWPVRYFTNLNNLLLASFVWIVCALSLRSKRKYVIFTNSIDGSVQNINGKLNPLLTEYTTVYKDIDNISDGSTSSDNDGEIVSKNFFSHLTLWWMNRIIKKGYQGKLKTVDDLFILPDDLQTSTIRENFSNSMKNEKLKEHGNPGQKKSLFSILNKSYGRLYYSLALLKMLMIILEFSGPIFLNFLVKFMENQTEPMKHGYYYVASLFLTSSFNVFIVGHYFYLLEIVRVYLRGSLITAIYEKTLSVSSSTLSSRFATGEVINYMTTDVDRILESCYDFHELWGVPIQIGACLYLLYQQVGIAVLASVGILAVFSPTTWVVTMTIKKLLEKMMKLKDERVKIITEILNGIRIIKFYAWEKHFQEKAGDARKEEMRVMRIFRYFQAVCIFFWVSTPFWMCIAIFSTFTMLGNRLTAANVFTTMALLSILNRPLNDLPWCISGLTNAWVSLKRLNVFLHMPEINYEDYFRVLGIGNNDVIDMQNGNFVWKDASAEKDIEQIKVLESKKEREKKQAEEEKKKEDKKDVVPFVLTGVNLRLQKGSFVGITGKVGSGKSSLFSSLIADMQKISGQLNVASTFDGYAFVAQEAWIQNMTVRDNILYGKPFDEEKYNAVIQACALKEDLKILPAGDSTEIGENGINLSGGQKARIAFARAVYQDKEIYLMDDPLAAVDSHVATHLFKHCIMGLLKNKTRILSTHHIKYLRKADEVIIMKDGSIAAKGNPTDILSNEEFNQLVKESSNEDDTEKKDNENNKDEKEEQSKNDGKLVDEEEMYSGSVSLKIYKYYIIENGIFAAALMFSMISIAKGFRYAGSWWLAYWTSHVRNTIPKLPELNITTPNITLPPIYQHPGVMYTTLTSLPFNHHVMLTKDPVLQPQTYIGDMSKAEVTDDLTFYLGTYCAIMIAGCFAILIRTLSCAYGSVQASTRIHKKLLSTILKAPVSFFDVTPIGRIINRFSSDIYSIDSDCAIYFQATSSLLGSVFGAIIMACYSIPWFTVILIPLGVIYYFIQKYYRHCSRQLKRISTVTRSPIYQHFSETLSGLTTIRAFQTVPGFIKQNEKKLDDNQRAYFSTQVVEVWLALRLGVVGVIMVTGVAVIAVIEHHYRSIDPGLVGLAITVSLSCQNLFEYLVKCFTRLEKGMVNTERVLHYIKETAQEQTGISQVPSTWPTQGVISLRNVCLRYRDDLPLVLNDVSLDIRGGEKVGICGRTGSGKSSLFRLLFKIVGITSGEVVIDNISLENAVTENIRSQMSIIPQEPFLFDDTVSKNLDPKDKYTDEQKLDVLEKCHLSKAVEDLGGLSGKVGEKGNNLSAGQKQLICLARALLKKAKIIYIDEATASVDLATDNLIQQTIRTEFSASTVLTIAHRLETIMDSDRILVMENGRVGEFDSPNVLLSNPNSLFTSLVKESHRSHQESS